MTRISKDGGIDDMVANSNKPIDRVAKLSIRQLHTNDNNSAI